ncbi:MAG: hypothetical protein WDM71_03095 [Ferruginibacter sp.]
MQKKTQSIYKLSFLVIFTIGNMYWNGAFAQNSNITINTTPAVGSANGTWTATGGLTDKLYTFTPNADNAQLNVAEILDCLTGATATISGGVSTSHCDR